MEIRPGLHRIPAPIGERFVALYLLLGAEHGLLVDTGVRNSITETLLPYLDARGIGLDRITWALTTHCDFDHTGGSGALKAAAPHVLFLAHAEDRVMTDDVEALIAGRYGEFRDSDGFDDPPELTAQIREVTQLVGVDRVVTDGEELDLGGRTVRILHVPGHSPGHLAVHDAANDAVLIGDATLGATVMTSDGRPAFPPTYRDVEPYLASIALFESIAPDLLLTAHYPVYEGEAVGEFLRESRAYVARIDDVVLQELGMRSAPVTTLDLIRATASRLGDWGAAASEYLIFPMTGNLERLEATGRVRSDRSASLRTWALPS
jgi:glyoxylase-like metal-dependent hydrolase (beta-lactamase superfamily II)